MSTGCAEPSRRAGVEGGDTYHKTPGRSAMAKVLWAAVAILAVSAAAYGLEFVEGVRHVDELNLAEVTRVPLDFRLSAVCRTDGDVAVRLDIPHTSPLARAAYVRLEVIRDGRTL